MLKHPTLLWVLHPKIPSEMEEALRYKLLTLITVLTLLTLLLITVLTLLLQYLHYLLLGGVIASQIFVLTSNVLISGRLWR